MVPSGKAVPVEPTDPDAEPARWREWAASTGSQFRDHLGVSRYLHLGGRDRERLVTRLREALDSALDVPPDLPERIAADVARLRERQPEADPVQIAWNRVRERARRTAVVGAATTAPAMIPGVGTALAALGLVADWRYVAEQQRDLVLEIAALLGAPLEDPTAQVRGLFLAGAGAAFGGKAVGEAAVKTLAEQVARRSVVRLLPGAGAAVSGALNYIATLAIGRAAIQRFARSAGMEVRGVIPERVHPQLSELRRAVVAALQTSDLAVNGAPVFDKAQQQALSELAAVEREELLDLAVATVAAEGAPSAATEAELQRIATALGVSDVELQALREQTNASAASYVERLRHTMNTARKGVNGATQRVWKRTQSIARNGWGKARRNTK